MKSISKVRRSNSFPIVGIGASAGGLEAFIELLTKIPTDTGMAFVLIQHLDPKHPSLAAEIISRAIALKTEEVKDGTQVQPNHVYVIPPNYIMGILDGVLSLSARSEAPGQMVIDFFLQSLAQSEKNKAIGVVLSGTGTDGTKGLTAIKAQGGATFVEDPKSAKYGGMPQSAIDSKAANLILRPEDIAKELVIMATYPEPALRKIFNLLRTKTKIDFSDYKDATIKRRIQRRMAVLQTKSTENYAEYLQTHKEEVLALYNDLLINVTDFFRDPESFKALRSHVFPSMIKNRPTGMPIRIWVPGCSTGEEAYSIAISLIEFLSETGKQYPIQIFATDISEPAIQKARIGQYSEKQIKNLSEERLKYFFDKVERGYKIHKMVRDLCVFSKHDVSNDPPFARLDLISCRNVLIYFKAVMQKRILQAFHYALNPEGYIWLGKSENPGESSKLFNFLDKENKIYSRSNVQNPINFNVPIRHSQESPEVPKKEQVFTKHAVDFQKDADKLLLSKFAPPGVIINEDLEILQFRGRTVPFLEPPTGQPSLKLLKMVRPELLTSLHEVIQSVKNENMPAIKHGLRFEADGKLITVDIEVLPISPLTTVKNRTFLILFKDTTNKEKQRGNKKNKTKKTVSARDMDHRAERIRELEKELLEIKNYQQSIVEQYETAQEELTSTTEELQSTNEELLSTNEEIETTKEELQATNEELVTVNDELQARNTDLTVLSGDLSNILSSIEMPILILGGNHRVRRYSPETKNAFNLIPADIGRSISDIKPDFNLDLDNLMSEVVAKLSPKEIEVQDTNGVWSRVQIRPYRTVDNKIDGTIITLTNIDALKQKEIRTTETLDYITSVAETVPLPLAVVNHLLQFQSANDSFYKYFQVSDKPIGKDILTILEVCEPYLQSLRESLPETMKENKPFTDFEIECEVPQLGTRKILLSGGKIRWIGAERAAFLFSFVDVTEQRQLEVERKLLLKKEQEARHEAENANRTKDIFLATLSHELRTPLSSILTWAQLISHGKVDFEKAKQGAAVIEHSAKTQSQLIDDLLDISRITAGKLSLDIKPVDPRAIIHLAIESVRPIAEKRSIQIESNLCSETMIINADPVRLQQIIWNLLTNAIKFSPKESSINIQLRYIEEHAQRFAQIKVSDRGKGIPPEFLPQIFNQFSQADSASTRLHGGLGLGLSIVHNLVQLQNGRVSAENALEGTGAIFTVSFPVSSLPKAAIIHTEIESKNANFENTYNKTISPPKLDDLRILLVDDDEGTREAITIYLKSLGAEVMTVASAREAFEKISGFKPNILVSDIAMPGEDGYSLIKKIRTLSRDQGGDTPALALTAYATAEDAKRALNAGFQAHMAKPVEANELGRIILKFSK